MGILFEGGSVTRGCVADALAVATQLLRSVGSMDQAQKYCVLVSNTLPGKEVCQYVECETFDGLDARAVAEHMKLERVFLSVISPRKTAKALEELFDVARTQSMDTMTPSNRHLCRLSGLKIPQESQPDSKLPAGVKVETAQSPPLKKVKVEDAPPSAPTWTNGTQAQHRLAGPNPVTANGAPALPVTTATRPYPGYGSTQPPALVPHATGQPPRLPVPTVQAMQAQAQAQAVHQIHQTGSGVQAPAISQRPASMPGPANQVPMRPAAQPAGAQEQHSAASQPVSDEPELWRGILLIAIEHQPISVSVNAFRMRVPEHSIYPAWTPEIRLASYPKVDKKKLGVLAGGGMGLPD